MKNYYRLLRIAQTKKILITSTVEIVLVADVWNVFGCLLALSDSSEWRDWWIMKGFI